MYTKWKRKITSFENGAILSVHEKDKISQSFLFSLLTMWFGSPQGSNRVSTYGFSNANDTDSEKGNPRWLPRTTSVEWTCSVMLSGRISPCFCRYPCLAERGDWFFFLSFLYDPVSIPQTFAIMNTYLVQVIRVFAGVQPQSSHVDHSGLHVLQRKPL